EHKKDVAKDVASFMRWGATIERVSIEYARKAFCGSSHGKKGDNCPHPNACPDNEITTWDQYSNDADQNRLQGEFQGLGYPYSKKRGFRSQTDQVGIEDV